MRFPKRGGLYAWEFEKEGRELHVRVGTRLILKAAGAGLGLAFVLEDHVRDHLADGRLLRVLEDWRPPR